MNDRIERIKGRLDKYSNVLYQEPSNFENDFQAKADIKYLLKLVEQMKEKNDDLESALDEVSRGMER